jgi:hypothetical protein
MKRSYVTFVHLLGFAALVVLPLAGARLAGYELTRYAGFPPPPPLEPPPAFSATVFALMAALVAITVLPPLLFSLRHIRRTTPPPPPTPVPLPWWGWGGLLLGVCAWIVAWLPADTLQPLRRHTFTPLWLSYTLVANALTVKRNGSCTMTRHPVRWVLLFPLSAAFWWFFEFLNRFVQNWYYTGIDDLTPLGYIVFATLPFATVLPAVLGTAELLHTLPRLGAALDTCRPLEIGHPKTMASIVLLIAATGLLLIPIHPNALYPLLWVSPLLILAATRTLAGCPTLFDSIQHGRWRRICLLALAGLICGFFWEMWNMWSLAKWHYAVPYVSLLHLFEMPLLGFAGYLPFGLECALIADMLLPPEHPPT